MLKAVLALRFFVLSLFVSAMISAPQLRAQEPVGDEYARESALRFGNILVRGETALLRDLLPQRGKVRIQLVRLGEGSGSFSAAQTQAILRSVLREGKVVSYELVGLECAQGRFALARARVLVSDDEGRSGLVDLRLTFEPEAERWVLREIRETE